MNNQKENKIGQRVEREKLAHTDDAGSDGLAVQADFLFLRNQRFLRDVELCG